MATLTRRSEQPFMSLRDVMSQLIADSFTPAVGTSGGQSTAGDSLPMNLYEDGEKYYLAFQAPGIDPQAVEITAANGLITVVARRQAPDREGWRTLWQEIGPAELRRQIRLPVEFDPNGIAATSEQGVIWLTVPKAEHVKPKTIKVQAAS